MSQQQPQSPTSPAASSVSLASTTSTSSTATLLPKKVAAAGGTPTNAAARAPAPPKDFEASFAALSSSYGFGGHMPTKPAKKDKKDKKDKSKKGKGKAKDDSSGGASASTTNA